MGVRARHKVAGLGLDRSEIVQIEQHILDVAETFGCDAILSGFDHRWDHI